MKKDTNKNAGFLKETDGTKVQNPDQNKEIHNAALGRNAHK